MVGSSARQKVRKFPVIPESINRQKKMEEKENSLKLHAPHYSVYSLHDRTHFPLSLDEGVLEQAGQTLRKQTGFSQYRQKSDLYLCGFAFWERCRPLICFCSESVVGESG